MVTLMVAQGRELKALMMSELKANATPLQLITWSGNDKTLIIASKSGTTLQETELTAGNIRAYARQRPVETRGDFLANLVQQK